MSSCAAEDDGVAFHFFPDSLADSFEVGQEHSQTSFAADLHGWLYFGSGEAFG